MAGLRRSQALGIALSIALIYFLFFAGSDTTDFRRTTEESLSRRRGILRGDLSDADLTAQTNRELQMILDQQNAGLEPTAAQAGGRKSQSQATSVPFDEDDASVAGRISIPKSKEKPKYPVDGTAAHGLDSGGEEVAFNGNKIEKAKDEGEDAAREEFHNILKKSPSTYWSCHALAERFAHAEIQSSSSRNPIAPTRSEPKLSFYRPTPSHLPRTSLNLI